MTALLTLYLVGVLVGLVRTDGGPVDRVSCALLWPLGPLAFVLTVAGLVVVALLALPGGRRGAGPPASPA